MAGRNVEFDIIANDRASSALHKVGGAADKTGGRLGKLGSIAGAAALGGVAALAAGVAGVGAFMVQGVKDAASYQTLQRKTEAVLKSTGNAAGTSVEKIQTLAGSLESLSGVDEELIVNSQNVLATFTAVQNKVGKGNDIFDQATKTALDMSVALGTDLQGATLQIGKALNNPTKGITALSRAGVSFTEAQKKQIKTLQESGDVLGAQKIILGEVSKEFGGAAKAAGSGFEGSLARLKDTVGDFGRKIGTALLPKLEKAASWLAKKLPDAIAWLEDAWESISTAFTTKNPLGRFTDGAYKMQRVGYLLRVGWDKLTAAGKLLSGWFTNVLKPAISSTVQTVMPLLRMALDNIRKAFKSTGDSGADWGHRFHLAGQVIAKVVQAVIIVVAALAVAVSKNVQTAKWALDNVLVPAFKAIAKSVLFQLGLIINGAASAFGWVPGLGPKLRTAAREFNKFAQKVTDELNGIPDRNIIVRVNGKQVGFNKKTGRATVNNKPIPDAFRAAGGPVTAGKGYIVGENGPEFFHPGTSGTIIPNGGAMVPAGSGRGGTVVHQTINLSGIVGDRVGLARELRKIAREASLSGATP